MVFSSCGVTRQALGAVGAVSALAVAAFGAGSDARSGIASQTLPRTPHSQASVSAVTSRTGKKPRYRFMINSDSGDQSAVASYGYNLLDVTYKQAADVLPAGTRALVWVGDYDNTKCAWEVSDSALTKKISGMAGDPKVAGYNFSDEPDPNACPNAPADHAARSGLIHRLDPGKLTVMGMDANSGQASLNQMPRWVGAADYVALDPYPCRQGKPCDYRWIDAIIAAANRAGLHYWGVVQAFNDSHWRWPTPAEAKHMLAQWARSRQSGYMTFAWKWAGQYLSSRPRLLAEFKRFNRAAVHRRALASKRRPVAATADEVHYTFTGPTSLAFDWRGTARTIRYGRTARYGRTVRARLEPAPFSSAGPFWEAKLSGLKRGTRYHYSIGGSPDQIMATAPTRGFRFDVEGDVGDSGSYENVRSTQQQIAADKPAFVIVAGDLSYGNAHGQSAVDRHFNDVMVWSRRAAYMPAWGNHEWDTSTDDLRNYKGRFAIPNGQASPGAPSQGCCGEDWGWFDAGAVRFISYPEPYTRANWPDWQSKADRLMRSAQASPRIHFIVTFGHRPAYSSGHHAGESSLAGILNAFGDRYSKYVLNLNGHSHDYERFLPIHHVVHITAAGGGASLEPWSSTDSRTAYRSLHLVHVRVNVSPAVIQIQAVCGPASSTDGNSCPVGRIVDSYTIRHLTP
jgi:hypothetical protein